MLGNNTTKPICTTSTGQVQGVQDALTGQCLFLGIPYAEPPVGGLRFKPTVPKSPWSGVLDASRFGSASPQVFDPTEGNYEEFTDIKVGDVPQAWVGNEDSLTLNIWTPSPDTEKRPVLVWIHGGANWLESSRLATYHGDSLVERGDIVFVSFNYRLGIFGFLDLSVIGGDEFKGSHSNGLRDQLTALRWIKDNIAVFGGDPENITIMGESAGSMNISWLLTSGYLDGIAQRVVMMSGVANLMGLSGNLNSVFTEEYGRERARSFLVRLGIDSMQTLQNLSTAEIMERVTAVAQSSDILIEMDSLFYPRVSLEFTPVDPLQAVHKNGSHGIDVMMGYTAYEMGLWLFWDKMLDKRPCQWAAERILDFTPSMQEEAVALYGEIFINDTVGSHGMHLLGDSIFVMPTMWFADELARHRENVWMYQFDWKTDETRRALHAADQTFLFNKHATHAGHSLLDIPKDDADKAVRAKLTEAMQDAILAFVRYGDPDKHTNAHLPAWKKYSEEGRPVLSFDTVCEIKKDPAQARRVWWYQNVYERNGYHSG